MAIGGDADWTALGHCSPAPTVVHCGESQGATTGGRTDLLMLMEHITEEKGKYCQLSQDQPRDCCSAQQVLSWTLLSSIISHNIFYANLHMFRDFVWGFLFICLVVVVGFPSFILDVPPHHFQKNQEQTAIFLRHYLTFDSGIFNI